MTSPAIVEARNRYQRNRYKQIRQGTWRGRMNAQKARERVDEMRRIWLIGYETIAIACGQPKSQIHYLMEGKPAQNIPPPQKVNSPLYDAIMAFTVEDLHDDARINSIGSRRRLQALGVAGWPMHEIARRANADEVGLVNVRTGPGGSRGQTLITVSLARRIQAAFEEMIRLDPADYLTKRAVSGTRARATAAGWLPAKAWAGEFDDPDTKPWTGVRCSHPDCPRGSRDERELCTRHLEVLAEKGTLDGTRVNKGDVLVDEARLLLAADDTYIDAETGELQFEHLAWRLGTTEDALDHLLSRRKLTRRDLLAEAVSA